MRVLVACEFSGTVRDAFRARGHDAWSCDLLPCEADPRWHFQEDIRKALKRDPWDLMVAHPPCTHICVSGNGTWANSVERLAAMNFVMTLGEWPDIHRIAVENPVGQLSTYWRKPDQIIQPWQFGHPESKATCLWLKGLPKLKPTRTLAKPASGRWNNQTPSGQNKLGPSADRWKERSLTYVGIARAMAAQWG